MKENYNRTLQACFVGYVVQAIVNNFVPLLFLTFQGTYEISLEKITLLVTFNFGLQLIIDLVSIGFVDRIGYRASMILAHLLAALGLILLTILPEVMSDPFGGPVSGCAGVCSWRRTSGGAGKPGCGGMPYR